MNFYKLIINNKFLRYSSFWWWVRLMDHRWFRFDDYHIWGSFWSSLNSGWLDINYKWEFENYWGKGAKVETTILPAEDFDNLVKKLNEPPDPEAVKRITEILQKVAPWEREDT